MSYYLISQTIIVQGWNWDQAIGNVLHLHAILNQMIADNTVDILLEMPESGVYVYRIKENDKVVKQQTYAYMIGPVGIPELFEIATDKIADDVVSQIIVVKGWNIEQASEHTLDVLEVVNQKIDSKSVDIFLQEPAIGVYVYRILDADAETIHRTHVYLPISTGEIDIYWLAGGKFEEERTDVTR